MRRAPLVRVTRVFIRLLLVAYPTSFRQRYADHITAHAAGEVADAPSAVAAMRAALSEVATAAIDLPAVHAARWRKRGRGRHGAAQVSGLASDFRLARRHVASSAAVALVVLVTFAVAIGASRQSSASPTPCLSVRCRIQPATSWSW